MPTLPHLEDIYSDSPVNPLSYEAQMEYSQAISAKRQADALTSIANDLHDLKQMFTTEQGLIGFVALVKRTEEGIKQPYNASTPPD